MNNLAQTEPVAVIGMAGRFPGAADAGRLWANLSSGVESIRFPSDEELLAAGVPPKTLADSHYVKAVAAAPEIDGFDAAFFGMTPREARICDPQTRLFLECAHNALEDAGYDPGQVSDVGVFGATGANHYLDLVRRGEGVDLRGTSGMSIRTWNSIDYLAPMVSYKLGLNGPSMAVQTACSSSLVAVHLAAASLIAGECELALAGGVEVELPLGHGYWWEPGGALSQDGHCRPFDKAASGTVFSSGAGMVVLKRLSDALADGDRIRAVIRSTAVNNDGSAKAGFAAPSVSGLAMVVAEAMAMAGVGSRDVSMVEAHATGTVLGDPIEVAALRAAYRQLGSAESGQCALTSIKGNVGHLGHAAGVTSLIKVALSLEHESIPANVGYQDPNPALELDGSPFQVAAQAAAWPRRAGLPRIAAVNTFGVGGTNAHAIIEEAPAVEPVAELGRPRVVVWSARTSEAADRYRDRLVEHFAGPEGAAFTGSVATLQRGRTEHAHRGAVVAADPREAAALLRDPASAGHLPPVAALDAAGQGSEIAFLFPGLGSQHVGVAWDLYEQSTAYAEAFDQCLDLFEAQGVPLRRLWLEGEEAELDSPYLTQPLIFSVEYSLARTWQSWGIRPTAVIGHSLGEITAATVAGVFTLEDAVRAVTVRSRAVQDTPPGGMLAVAASRDQVVPFLAGNVSIALVNSLQQVVVAGPADELAEVGAALEAAGLSCRRVRTTHAIHTPLTQPAVPVFDETLRGLQLSPPTVDFYSAALGRLAGPDEAVDPGFWSSQLVRPVLFADALDAMAARPGRLLMVEVGPGRALTTVARRHPDVTADRHRVIPTLAQRRTDPLAEVRSALAAVAAVWTEGHPVDWSAVEDLAEVGRVPVPGYPYERTRYWIDLGPEPDAAEGFAVGSSPFSLASWQEKSREPLPPDGAGAVAVTLLPPNPAWAQEITEGLRGAGLRVVSLTPGTSFEDNTESFVIRPGEVWDLARVFRSLKDRGVAPGVLVHAGTLGLDSDAVREQLTAGFASGAELVRQAARASIPGPRPGLLVLTEHAVDVSGHDPLRPGYAALTALVRAVPDEDVVDWAKLVDLGDRVSADDLADEIRDRGGDRLVALRGDRRWVPAERPFAVKPGPDTPLRRGGVYLLTGGTGGLGGVVARELAGTGLQPVLVLAGRKDPADCEQLPALLAELTALGATAEAASCDVTDPAALAALVDDVTRRHCAVNGVFHLAGVVGSGMVAFTSTARSTATIGPKVFGALALAEVFAGRPPLDLFVAFSSRAALDGMSGGADYAAANAVLGALVRAGLPAADRVLSIDWPRWRDVGMAAAEDPSRGLAPDQGGALLLELLSARTPRQVGVRHFLHGRPASSAAAAAAANRIVPAKTASGSAPAAAPSGQAAPVDRSAPTEARLRALWTALLGRPEIAADADFFDLGGNSLTAVELMSRVRAEFGVDLGVVALFDHPTLAALAVEVDRREA
jgi:phthiocerol/phenolphthiocerol synthesis type-I polyketide synthase E